MELRVPAVTPPMVPSRPRPPSGGHPPGWAGGPPWPLIHFREGRPSRVLPVPTRPGLLDCVERYFAAAPLPDARIEVVGALEVPVGDPVWPHPARPRLDGG